MSLNLCSAINFLLIGSIATIILPHNDCQIGAFFSQYSSVARGTSIMAVARRIRNKGYMPYVSTEGAIIKPFPAFRVPSKKGVSWHHYLTPFERCYAHQTLASVRRYAHFKPFNGLIPENDLDFVMASTFDQSAELFPDKADPFLQPETLGHNTWRRLRNTQDVLPERKAKGSAITVMIEGTAGGKSVERYNNSHPVLIGGIKEREHPGHVKLMNSSHHAPQTNAGYSRQDRDGTKFQY